MLINQSGIMLINQSGIMLINRSGIMLINQCMILISAPRIQIEKSAYSIPEPSAKDQIAMITVKVVRLGDVSKAGNVRCSTRDGSAFSGTDYNPKSQVMQFSEGNTINKNIFTFHTSTY